MAEEKKETIIDVLLKPIRSILSPEEGEERPSLAERIEKFRETLGLDKVDEKVKEVLKELEVDKRVEKIKKINEIVGITELTGRVKEFIERLDLPNQREKLKESLEKLGVKSERVQDILDDLGIKERETKIQEIMEVAGLGADFKEMKELLGIDKKEA
ncbi:MAG: hypothetical protein ACTSRW_07370 [Candidatus Helarchaeota archaeon]